MEISFIIPNYHSEKYLEKCLASIERNVSNINHEIIIVNNDASEIDLSFENSSVHILNTFSNLGFSKACNLGAKIAKGKILFFLNPDTEIMDAKLLEFLFLLNKKEVGIIAPSLVLTSGQLQPWSGGENISPLSTIFQNIFHKNFAPFPKKDAIVSLAWVSGAALLIRKNLFEKVGGFDENFFMYFEDVDLCKRMRKLGKKVLLLSQPNVLHYGGSSINNNKTQKQFYYTSQDYYFEKHFGQVQAKLIKFIRKLFILIKTSF